MPIAPVLQTFANDELTRTPALIERVWAGSLQLLSDAKDATLAGGQRGHQGVLVNALKARAGPYQAEFVKALTRRVREALCERRDDSPPAAPPPEDDGLALMDESRVEADIEISRAMQVIDAAAEWELRELQMFTSTLIGQKHVSAESNPFRPGVYAAALWQATEVISPLPAHRAILLRVSCGVAAGLLKTAWAAACSRLEGQGVVPGVYRTVLLPAGSASRTTPTVDVGRAGSLGGLLASMPDGTAVGRPGAVPSPGQAGAASPGPHASQLALEQTLARFDELLRTLPPTAGRAELAASLGLGAQRAALVAVARAPLDHQTIELMARVFDVLLSDPQLPLPFIGVLARLQSSALRVALNEPGVFESTGHPVWQLLDRIGEAAGAYPQANDPRANALLSACHSLADQLVMPGRPEGGRFRHALTRLDHFLAGQCRAQLDGARPAVQALQLAERRDQLEHLLRQRLIDQMSNVRTTPVVRRFVTTVWAQVLAEAMLTHGEQGERTRSYIKLVDELLWSLQLPDHPRSRQRLLALLPDILKRLRAGMASIALREAERQSVLDELMTIHAEALRPGRGDADALTPEQLVQRMRDEVLPASTGNGGFSDSVIDLASMETVPAALLPSGNGLTADDPIDRVSALRAGERQRLFLQGRWSRVQLLWRSDHGQFCLFGGETAGRTHSVTRPALERLAAAGLLQPYETRPLVQRSLDALTREVARSA